MKKQIFLFAFVFIFLIGISFISASYCSSNALLNTIPCDIETIPLSCSSPVIIQSTTNISLNETADMIKINISCSSSCLYNFTFNYSINGNYRLDLCDGITYGFINVYNNSISSPPDFTISKQFFILDFTNTLNLMILGIFFIIIVLLMFVKQFVFAGFLTIIVGFILLFSGVNLLISFLVIAMGIVIIFVMKKKK